MSGPFLFQTFFQFRGVRMQISQECVIVDPEFLLYMVLPNCVQAFGTALFLIVLGYGFLNLSGAFQQTELFHFIVF